MAVSPQLTRFAARKLTRRISRSLPWVGGALALLTLGAAIRRKGMIGGTAHTVLDSIPYVGAVKNVVEFGRGRDFFRDRADRVAAVPTGSQGLTGRTTG
jgi:hypothetical protein